MFVVRGAVNVKLRRPHRRGAAAAAAAAAAASTSQDDTLAAFGTGLGEGASTLDEATTAPDEDEQAGAADPAAAAATLYRSASICDVIVVALYQRSRAVCRERGLLLQGLAQTHACERPFRERLPFPPERKVHSLF